MTWLYGLDILFNLTRVQSLSDKLGGLIDMIPRRTAQRLPADWMALVKGYGSFEIWASFILF